MLKLTDDVLKNILAKAIAAAGPLDPTAVFVGLASAVTDKGQDTTLADVTEATGAVATRVEVTAWSAPYKMSDGRWVVDGPICTFSPLNSSESQGVSFFFFASLAAAGVLKGFGSLGGEIPLPDENKQVSIVPRITIAPDGRYGAEIVWNG